MSKLPPSYKASTRCGPRMPRTGLLTPRQTCALLRTHFSHCCLHLTTFPCPAGVVFVMLTSFIHFFFCWGWSPKLPVSPFPGVESLLSLFSGLRLSLKSPATFWTFEFLLELLPTSHATDACKHLGFWALLTLAQHGFDFCRPTYMWISFSITILENILEI